MMMRILLLIALTYSFSASAQTYHAGKPVVVDYFAVPSSSETGKLAWFFPSGDPGHAKQFETVEYGIMLPASVEHKIKAFFADDHSVPDQINPFNRHDIDITAKFYLDTQQMRTEESNDAQVHGPEVKVTDAFYYEEFRRDLGRNDWRKDTTSYPFRIRFSPEEVGLYTVEIFIEAKGIPITTTKASFNVRTSANKGFLEQGANYKHLRYSKSKKSFMGVGQVIPWAEYEDWYHTDQATGPAKFMPMYQAFQKMHEAGGNFTRFVAAPWFMQLEWEALGNYRPKMGQAWEFDRMNERCADLDIYYIFCALLHSPLESKPGDNANVTPGISWQSYCYNGEDNSPAKIHCSPTLNTSEPADFYGDPEANDHQKNYFRYLVSRWGFSTALAGWQLMSEADQTCEYRDEKQEDGTMKDNSENRKKLSLWAGNMVKYMHDECSDNHPKSISLITGINYSSKLWDASIFKYDDMQFFGLHDYVFEMDPPSKNIRNRNLIQRYESVTNMGVGLEDGLIVNPEFQKKMFIYDEFGHVTVVPRKIPEDKDDDAVRDLNNCADFSFKQDLWFTFSSGCAIAGLDWWNEHQATRQKMWKRYFPGMMSFAENIDFENVNYATVRERKGDYYIAQRWPLTRKGIERSNEKAYRKSDKVEAYIQVDSLGQQGFGWMLNRSFHWANLIDSIACLAPMANGTAPYAKKYLLTPIDDDLVNKPLNIGPGEAFIRVYNVQRRAMYTVDFYDTETGELIESRKVKSSRGTLKIYPPSLVPSERYDLAFKFYDSSLGWK